MPGPDDILQRMLQQNPVVRNNPNNAPILNALERRDAQSGQQLAQNYINTLGMDWNTALQQAKAFQSNQNAYLVAQLKTPAPVPAYTVPNPNGYYGCQQNCYQSCGC